MQDTPSSARSGLWFIRVLALASILLLLWTGALYPCGDNAWLASAIGMAPYSIAYVWVLWRTERRLGWTLGLALAVFSIGSLCFFYQASPSPLIWQDRQSEIVRVLWASNVGVQALLFFATLRIRKTLGQSTASLLFGSFRSVGYLSASLVIPVLAMGNVDRWPMAAHEASAVGAIRTLHQCAEIARTSGAAGSSYSLRKFQEQGCLAEPLAGGETQGYRFSIGPRTDRGGNFVGYSISARPLEYGSKCSGIRSFYASEDGLIRYTLEDRPATASDPVLQ